ncbi:hypothetical protein NM688_g1547 [Phlebia brevispora]|uniref:Uncharacterized protein n=1 Tax=Phlebia brevispora TaxID=194682 RepID=A0ACC1TAV2_9APHY|nr:hypothetical protein NM688_g1547 [Phlebia brevispora]
MLSPTPSVSTTTRCLDTPRGTPYEVPLESFIKSVLPPLPSGLVVDEVIRKLEKAGKKSSSQKPITRKGRWRGFPVDPEATRVPEETCLRNLESVFRSILKAAATKTGRRPSLRFQNNPACVTWSLDRTWDTFPDAFWSRESGCSWYDLAVSGEYKKKETNGEEHDNAMKVTMSMLNCMRRDPCRRFTFAFTVENTRMKLWFCDRAQLLCSTPFNFILDREYLVHFCLSIAYAEPDQLGWDPTVVLANDRRRYDITVLSDKGEARVYRTLELISCSGAQVLLGRGTRVWKVVQVENGEERGNPMVLKDVWANPRRKREGTILDELRKADYSPYSRQDFECAYLSRVLDGDVFNGPASTNLDNTHMFGLEEESASDREKRSSSADSWHSTSVLAPFPSISSEPSLVIIFSAFAQAVTALHLMHIAGWVHRDVSSGNILLAEDGAARLVDLEYTHKVNDADDEFRVGTPKYMAIEVHVQRYLFSRPDPFSPSRTLNTPPPATPERSLSPAVELPTPPGSKDSYEVPKTPIFRYNALHDMESLWWVAVHVIFNREVDSSADGGHNTASDEQRFHAENMFGNREDRFYTLVTQTGFSEKIMSLHPSVRHVAYVLENMRESLVRWHHKAEADLDSLDHTGCAEGLYDIFVQGFTAIAQHDASQYIRLQHFTAATDDSGHKDASRAASILSQEGEVRSRHGETKPIQNETNSLKRKSSSDDIASITTAKKAR